MSKEQQINERYDELVATSVTSSFGSTRRDVKNWNIDVSSNSSAYGIR